MFKYIYYDCVILSETMKFKTLGLKFIVENCINITIYVVVAPII